MKHARNEVTVEGALELPRVVETLESLVAALKSGAVSVQHGEDSIVLGPRGIVGFELTASEKGKRQRLALEFTWRKFSAADTDFDLKITPVAAPAAPADGEASEATEVVEPAKSDAGEAHEGETAKDSDTQA